MSLPRVATTPDQLIQHYALVRGASEELTRGLTPEDMTVQTMPDVSPTKWHLAHTTWFFETFILSQYEDGFRPFDPEFEYLFNSYYNGAGEQWPRHKRGLIARPGVDRILDYRDDVDTRMATVASMRGDDPDLAYLMILGLNHEQQHQELLLTDIKHVMGTNPTNPAYAASPLPESPSSTVGWLEFTDGVREVGRTLDEGFAYDNETPRHRVFTHAFELADRPVTCGEYLEFVRDGGYEHPDHWLSEGWGFVQEHEKKAPLYWRDSQGEFKVMTLHGLVDLDPHAPVCHVSYYEADAFARWRGARLPTEFEWEIAAARVSADPADGQFVEDGAFHPVGRASDQLMGGVWEWTASSYAPYPGYTPLDGTLGEYNGKFMVNQYVLRGGSCASSASHLRTTYRNFFPAHACWQFTGFRLARDA